MGSQNLDTGRRCARIKTIIKQKSIENICIEEVMENFEKRRKTKHVKEKIFKKMKKYKTKESTEQNRHNKMISKIK